MSKPILVIGAGVMGVGIAQVAAQAGHPVFLHDAREGAAVAAKTQLADTLAKLHAKGKLTQEAMAATLARVLPIGQLAEAKTALIAIEAIVEKLEAKRGLLRELEGLLAPTAILATNTSSISVTAIAAGCQRPQQVVGMHFFNPVPLMQLVEVVSGLQTAPAVAAEIEALASSWGKTPVHARSTPGFIVNRIARPYYAETLALLQERAAAPEELDACLRAAGFRMGPCELMDLIGHDTNFAVTNSVFEANFWDRRFTPSLVQRELVEGGLLGRKTGRGFYSYPGGAPAVATYAHAQVAGEMLGDVVVHGRHERLLAAFPNAEQCEGSDWTGLQLGAAQLRLTDGRPAREVRAAAGVANVAVFDELPRSGPCAYAVLGNAAWAAEAPAWLAKLGVEPIPMADTPGLVVARTLAMLVNEAADAVLQGVCSTEGADAAMKLGVNYPAGPFEWYRRLGRERVVALIEALDREYRGERYRVSPWLRRSV